jgi:chloride channel 3/4/5
MWLGKEGPLVHVACCCANLFMKLFDNINSNEGMAWELNYPIDANRYSSKARSAFRCSCSRHICRVRIAHRWCFIQFGGMRISLCSQSLLLTVSQQLSYYFPDKTMWQSFVCAMTAAVTLHALDPFRTGKLVLYQVVYTTGWHDFEMIPFAILGIFGVGFL